MMTMWSYEMLRGPARCVPAARGCPEAAGLEAAGTQRRATRVQRVCLLGDVSTTTVSRVSAAPCFGCHGSCASLGGPWGPAPGQTLLQSRPGVWGGHSACWGSWVSPLQMETQMSRAWHRVTPFVNDSWIRTPVCPDTRIPPTGWHCLCPPTPPLHALAGCHGDLLAPRTAWLSVWDG